MKYFIFKMLISVTLGLDAPAAPERQPTAYDSLEDCNTALFDMGPQKPDAAGNILVYICATPKQITEL